MKVTDPLLNGSFTKRMNRFLASIHIDGREEYAHIPNSGRMRELLTNGRLVKLRERESRRRKTRYDLFLVDYHGRWVSIDARLPGLLLAESIEIMDLTEAIGDGYEAWIVFICQREDVRFLSPNESADPHFAETLRMAHGLGVKVFAFNCKVTAREITLKDRIGVILEHRTIPLHLDPMISSPPKPSDLNSHTHEGS